MIVNYRNGPKHNETKRVGAIMLDYAYRIGSDSIHKYGEEMMSCGSVPLPQWADLPDGSFKGRIVYNTCKRRGCPPCEARKNLAFQKYLTSYLHEKGTDNFYFLTVTNGPSSPTGELKKVISSIGKKVSKLFRRKSVEFVVGGFRAFECNYNPEMDTFNPHFHILLEVAGEDLSRDKNILKFLDGPVFKKALKSFLDAPKNRHLTKEKVMKKIFLRLKKGELYQLVWSALLQSVGLGAVCNIQALADNKKGESSTPSELCKYLTKTMRMDDDKLGDFLMSMKGVRLFSSWGTMKINKKLVQDDVLEEADNSEGEAKKNDEVKVEFKGDGRSLKQVIFDADNFGNSKDLLIRRLALKNDLIRYEIDEPLAPALSCFQINGKY